MALGRWTSPTASLAGFAWLRYVKIFTAGSVWTVDGGGLNCVRLFCFGLHVVFG
jgi:hypothetical protein